MKLQDYPTEIELTRLNLQEVSELIQALKESSGLVADQVAGNIASALDENDKPRYSNETKRAAAIALELKENESYQSQIRHIRMAEKTRANLDAGLERLRGEFSVAKLEFRQQIISREEAA